MLETSLQHTHTHKGIGTSGRDEEAEEEGWMVALKRGKDNGITKEETKKEREWQV